MRPLALVLLVVGCGPAAVMTPPVVDPQPQLDVLPATLSFGLVAQGARVERKLSLRNIGARGTGLHLVAPFAELVGGDADFALTAIPLGPIEAGAAPVELGLAFTPSSAGAHQVDVHIHTSAGPMVVPAVAQVPPEGDCRFEVTPSTGLDFGSQQRPAALAVTVRNVAGNVCRLPVRLETTGAFSLDANPLMLTLLPGEAKPVTVHAQGVSAESGKLSVGDVEVSLRQSESVWLLVVPDTYDFGTVPLGCGSGPRQFNFYRNGGGLIEVRAPSNEAFKVTSIGPNGFFATFSPRSLGPATAAVRVEMEGVEYIVSVSGNGDMAPHNQDTFINENAQRVFYLNALPVTDSITVQGTTLSWTYDGVQNAIVFSAPPSATVPFTVSYDVECR